MEPSSSLSRHLGLRWCLAIFLYLSVAAVAQTYTALSRDPLANDQPFLQGRVTSKAPNSTLWGTRAAPYPTGAWWTPMCFDTGVENFAAHPYYIKTRSPVAGRLEVAPWTMNHMDVVVALKRKQPGTSNFVNNMYLTAGEALKSSTLTGWSDLAVSLQWAESAKGGAGSMRTVLVQGSPFITMTYTALTPKIELGPDITIASFARQPDVGAIRKYRLGTTVPDMPTQTWLIYTTNNILLTASTGGRTVVASSKLARSASATIRLAHLPLSTNEAVLDTHANTYPTGGTLEFGHLSGSPDEYGVMKHMYNVTTMSGAAAPGNLLMMGLPHHQAVLMTTEVSGLGLPVTINNVIQMGSVRGTMLGVVSPSTSQISTWTLLYPLSSVSWHAGSIQPVGDLTKEQVAQDIANAIINDQTFSPPMALLGAADNAAYFGNAELASIGRTIIAAEAVLNSNLLPSGQSPDIFQLGQAKQTLTDTLRGVLDKWLDGTAPDAPVYDTTWGGTVAKQSLGSSTADYGHGIYNDHHYHWGYFTYAAAAVAKDNQTWAIRWRPRLLALVRDFANPSPRDSFFPFARHFDFYEGHSWANGVEVWWDGKNQEATGEAVHAYYAVQLLGSALNDQRLERWGRLLAAMETHSSKAYWQMRSSNNNYPSTPVLGSPTTTFKDNKVVGILWSTQAEYRVWFYAGNLNDRAEFAHAIQYLPFTPISQALLDPIWVSESVQRLKDLGRFNTGAFNFGFRMFTLLGDAINNPSSAYNELRLVAEGVFHSGPNMWSHHSKGACLYWIATRCPSTGCV